MSFIFYKKLIKVYKDFSSKKGINVINYTSIVLIGDKNGGLGVGKASNSDQNVSIFKALNKAKCNFFKIYLKNNTIPYSIIGKSSKCIIQIFPLNKVYKFSSGSHVRSILNIMGIYKISSKIYGSKNFYNVLNAVINSLLGLKKIFFIKNKCF